MRPEIRRRLCVPAILAVSTVSVAPACKDDDRTTTDAATETVGTSAATTETSTMGTGTMTTGPTTGMTDTDGVPNCSEIADQATCEATELCFWPPELESCTVDCMKITDEMTCGTQQFCFWNNNVCEIHII